MKVLGLTCGRKLSNTEIVVKEALMGGQVTSIEFRQAQLNLLSAELSRNQAKYEAKLAELFVLQLSGELLNVNF